MGGAAPGLAHPGEAPSAWRVPTASSGFTLVPSIYKAQASAQRADGQVDGQMRTLRWAVRGTKRLGDLEGGAVLRPASSGPARTGQGMGGGLESQGGAEPGGCPVPTVLLTAGTGSWLGDQTPDFSPSWASGKAAAAQRPWRTTHTGLGQGCSFDTCPSRARPPHRQEGCTRRSLSGCSGKRPGRAWLTGVAGRGLQQIGGWNETC